MKEDTKKIIGVGIGIALLLFLFRKASAEPPNGGNGEPPPNGGDTGSIYGFVFEDPGYVPIPYGRVVARLSPSGPNFEGPIDATGHYEIFGCTPGTYHVQGYDSAGNPCGYRTGIVVQAGKRTSCNIALWIG